MTCPMRHTQEEDRLKAIEKRKSDEINHRKAMEANERMREAAELAKQREWEYEMRVNKQWKETLDRQVALLRSSHTVSWGYMVAVLMP